MGLNTSSKKTYLTIMGGKVVRRVKEGVDGSVSRQNKNGITVHEIHYDSLEGNIKNISTRDSEYGKEWLVDIEDNSIEYQLQIPFRSGYSTDFLKRIGGANLSERMTLKPYFIEDGDKKRAYLVIYQNSEKVGYQYTRDNPNGMPELEQVEFQGKMRWDDTKRMAFFEGIIKNDIVPKLNSSRPAETFIEDVEPTSGAETFIEHEDDDLPFD